MSRSVWTMGLVGLAAAGLLAGCQPASEPAQQQAADSGPVRGAHHFVPAGAGKNYVRDGMSSELKLSAAQSEGRWTVLDEIWHPGFAVSSHYHNEHSELFHVLAGKVEWIVNGEKREMGPGDTVYIPAEVIHATRVLGDEDVHIIMVQQPGGHEAHLEEEQRYTPEQRAQPETLELLRSHYDFNPAPMPAKAVIAPPMAIPESGVAGPRGVRPQLSTPRPAAHRFIIKGEGETTVLEHETSSVKVNTDDTDGQYSFLDEIWHPTMVVEPHYHTYHAEVFYVVDGQLEWTVGGETRLMGPGDLVYIPPNTVHSVKVVGGVDEHNLMLFQPGGYEYYWRRNRQYTEDELKDPAVRQTLRSEQDYHAVN